MDLGPGGGLRFLGGEGKDIWDRCSKVGGYSCVNAGGRK